MEHFKNFPIKNDFLEKVEIITIIPAYNEENLLDTLESLSQCNFDCYALVLVFINAPSNASKHIIDQNQKCHKQIQEKIALLQNKYFKIAIDMDNQLPFKKAGVGLARKIAMDFASNIFKQIKKPKGIITSLDSDCLVDLDYFSSIKFYFNKYNLNGASLNFLHQNIHQKDGIKLYEIFLRLHVHYLRKIGFRNIYHTIGSSFAIIQKMYEKCGGMNTRKAGEDFYFVNKIVPYGNYMQLPKIIVFPSARQSTRVPFGTGKAIGKWQSSSIPIWYSYATEVYSMMQIFSQKLLVHTNAESISKEYKNIPKPLESALNKMDFKSIVNEMQQNTASKSTFTKKLAWRIDGFFLLKLSHHLRDDYFINQPLIHTAKVFFQDKNLSIDEIHNKLVALDQKTY